LLGALANMFFLDAHQVRNKREAGIESGGTNEE
jgi:hypothetical protein